MLFQTYSINAITFDEKAYESAAYAVLFLLH